MPLRLSERTSSSRAFWTILRLVLSRVSLRALRIRVSSRLILVLPMKAFYTDSQKLYTTGDILSDVRRAHADQRLRRKRSVGSRDGVKSLPWRGEGLVIKIAGAGFLAGALAVAAAQTRPYEQVEHGQVTSPDGTARVYTIRRLEPATFPQVPKSVRHELERRKCLIPQTSEAKGAENVISGEFREKGVKDWAALCSQEGYSTLLVFWRGSARTVAELGSGKDMDMMQTVDSPGEPGYS